jgi:phage tail-like protein
MAPESTTFIPFRFRVSLIQGGTTLCGGAFSEVTGLEATMAPKKIVEGGRAWGEVMRAGPVTFSTVVLKRGVTELDDAWAWFDAVGRLASFGSRLDGRIEVMDALTTPEAQVLLTWNLTRCLPVKFKGPDLSAVGTQVAIEELHLAHEGLTLTRGARTAAAQGA